MNAIFRDALSPDLENIIKLLKDDEIGVKRETSELGVYQKTFASMSDDPKTHCIVGEIKNRVVAYYQFNVIDGLSHNALRRGQIEDVRVASDLRSQGIGRMLILDAEQRALDTGCRVLQLVAHTARDRTRHFYEANGFTVSHNGFKRSL